MAASALDITQILSKAQSANAVDRQQAEQQLKQLQEGNHAVFLYSLSQELANNSKPTDTRRLAGLILKNALDAKEEKRKVGCWWWCFIDGMCRMVGGWLCG